jgi:predicted dehydrogenase
MSKTLQVGIMAVGWPSHMHTKALQAIKGVKVAAVSDPDKKRRKDFIDSYGVMNEFDDYRDMLKKINLDCVVIGLPTSMHYKASLESFKAGCHILCEKPPTTTGAEMKKLAQVAKQKKKIFMFARQPRYNAESLAARKMVARGNLGKVYHAEAYWVRARYLPTLGKQWRFDKNKGGGVLFDLGIHAIDNAWFVMGCPKPVEVFGRMNTAFSYLAQKSITYNADDMSAGMIRFENNATLTFTTAFSLNTAGSQQGIPDEHINPAFQAVNIFGTKGGIASF